MKIEWNSEIEIRKSIFGIRDSGISIGDLVLGVGWIFDQKPKLRITTTTYNLPFTTNFPLFNFSKYFLIICLIFTIFVPLFEQQI